MTARGMPVSASAAPLCWEPGTGRATRRARGAGGPREAALACVCSETQQNCSQLVIFISKSVFMYRSDSFPETVLLCNVRGTDLISPLLFFSLSLFIFWFSDPACLPFPLFLCFNHQISFRYIPFQWGQFAPSPQAYL